LFTAAPANEITIVALTGVEVVAAITRRARGGTITPADAASSCALFLSDLNADYEVVAVSDALLNQAIHLARLHSLRGYDAVQLAAWKPTGCWSLRTCLRSSSSRQTKS